MSPKADQKMVPSHQLSVVQQILKCTELALDYQWGPGGGESLGKGLAQFELQAFHCPDPSTLDKGGTFQGPKIKLLFLQGISHPQSPVFCFVFFFESFLQQMHQHTLGKFFSSPGTWSGKIFLRIQGLMEGGCCQFQGELSCRFSSATYQLCDLEHHLPGVCKPQFHLMQIEESQGFPNLIVPLTIQREGMKNVIPVQALNKLFFLSLWMRILCHTHHHLSGIYEMVLRVYLTDTSNRINCKESVWTQGVYIKLHVSTIQVSRLLRSLLRDQK